MRELSHAAEHAIKAMLDAAAIGATVLMGHSDDDQVRPCVVVVASEGDEYPVGSGNYNLTISISSKSNSTDSNPAEHDALCGAVEDVVYGDTFVEDANNAESVFHMFSPLINKRKRNSIEDDSWVNEISFTTYCCQVDLVE